MAGSQLGKSEVLLNVIGYHIDQDPAPILMIQPTESMAQAFSKDRIANGLLRATPALQDKVKDPRARDSNNTTLHKIFPGGSLSLVGANSPAGLASRPIRILLADEVDCFPASAGSEGDPISLGKKRTSTFFNRRIVSVSTPTIRGVSRIEEAYLQSDQRRYYVPCKHCDHHQTLKWANVKWEKDKPETAAYVCDECGALWSDADRRWSIRNGTWQAEAEFDGIAGFAISGLYSPWTPLSEGVIEFLRVKKSPEQLKVWTNTYLGESWEDEGETIEEFGLIERKESLHQTPKEVIVVVAGADVQDDRIEIETVGWGRSEESWSIDYRTLYGDPSTPQLWQDLEAVLLTKYETADGRVLQPRATCVDSGGHYTKAVYDFVRPREGRRIFAIKGMAGESRPIVSRPTRNNIGKIRLFTLGVDNIKELIFSRLRIQSEGPGFCHFPNDRPDEYFRQLASSEKIVTRYHKGFPRREFVKTRTRNEALDCRVYATGALAILNLNLDTLADRVKRMPHAPEKDEQKPQPIPRPQRRNDFVNGWR